MKKTIVKLLSLALFSALPVTGVIAADSSASVAVTSNYVFRGQTQNNDNAAVQGSYDIQQQKEDIGWYAGAFASNVTKGLEIDVFGGWRGSFGQNSAMGYDVGGAFYKYTDNTAGTDTTELYAGVNYETAYVKLFMGSVTGGTNYNYLDIGADFVVMTDIDLNVHVGTYISGATGMDASASLSKEVSGIDLSLTATYENVGNANDFELFFTASKSFDL